MEILLICGIVLGILIVVLIGVLFYYFYYKPKQLKREQDLFTNTNPHRGQQQLLPQHHVNSNLSFPVVEHANTDNYDLTATFDANFAPMKTPGPSTSSSPAARQYNNSLESATLTFDPTATMSSSPSENDVNIPPSLLEKKRQQRMAEISAKESDFDPTVTYHPHIGDLPPKREIL